MEIEQQSVLTQSHYIEFQKHVTKALLKHPKVRWLYQGAGFCFMLFLGVMVLYIIESIRTLEGEISSGAMNALIVCGLALVGWFVLMSLIKVQLAKAGAIEGGTMIGPVTHSLTKSSIIEEGENYRFQCSWSSIIGIKETPNLVILLTDPAKGVMIPITDISKRDEIIQFANQNISK